MLYAGYSDTRQGGSVSLPGFVRQNGGAPLIAPKKGTTKPPVKGGTGGTGGTVTPPKVVEEPRLPTTGVDDVAFPAAAALLGLAALAARRRRGDVR